LEEDMVLPLSPTVSLQNQITKNILLLVSVLLAISYYLIFTEVSKEASKLSFVSRVEGRFLSKFCTIFTTGV